MSGGNILRVTLAVIKLIAASKIIGTLAMDHGWWVIFSSQTTWALHTKVGEVSAPADLGTILNTLLSGEGKVFLSDFGVAAPLLDVKKRQSFVGTPCWMAPEVLEQTGGYDYKADIWSFGITAIELAHGEAPYQRLHPWKVIKIIIEKDPPRLDKRRWDSVFANLIESCLQKDPKKRPNMADIFCKHKKFFDKANEQPLIEILRSLPPLEHRVPGKHSTARPPRIDGSCRMVTGSWDFKTDDLDDAPDTGDFPDLMETES